jgi:hypothetical protein
MTRTFSARIWWLVRGPSSFGEGLLKVAMGHSPVIVHTQKIVFSTGSNPQKIEQNQPLLRHG